MDAAEGGKIPSWCRPSVEERILETEKAKTFSVKDEGREGTAGSWL